MCFSGSQFWSTSSIPIIGWKHVYFVIRNRSGELVKNTFAYLNVIASIFQWGDPSQCDCSFHFFTLSRGWTGCEGGRADGRTVERWPEAAGVFGWQMLGMFRGTRGWSSSSRMSFGQPGVVEVATCARLEEKGCALSMQKFCLKVMVVDWCSCMPMRGPEGDNMKNDTGFKWNGHGEWRHTFSKPQRTKADGKKFKIFFVLKKVCWSNGYWNSHALLSNITI